MRTEYFLPFALLVSVCAVVLWFRTARRFDRLLKQLYSNDHEKWVKLGHPVGFFWRPKQEPIRFFESANARNSLVITFIFSGADHPGFSTTELRSFRQSVLQWFLLCGAAAVVILFSIIAQK